MTVGKWIVVVCATLFCFVTIIFLRDLLTKKKEEPKTEDTAVQWSYEVEKINKESQQCV